MTSRQPGCTGYVHFDKPPAFSIKRLIGGCTMHTYTKQTSPEKNNEEIAGICLLDADDDKIQDLYTGSRRFCGHWCDMIAETSLQK